MGNPTASRRGERGFTLIEVMIAATVLVVGVLSTFKLIDGANTVNSLNGARLGAQGLEREIVEYARATDYDSLQPSQLVNVLRQRPSLAGTASPWKIRRRAVDYTVTASVCTFDDPKDGLAATPPANACPAVAAVNTLVDTNPDDFRRVTIKLDWRVRGHSSSMTQSALIVNPTGALGPRITEFDDTDLRSRDIGTGENQLSWGPSGRHLTSTAAAGVHWLADDRVSGGDATGGPTAWSFTWNLGNDQTHLSPLTLDNTWVPDGNYTLQAQAVDDRGVPGEARTILVHINRHPPAAVSGLAGGFNARFNGGVVDLHWAAYPERDVHGYVVYRDQADADHLVCPSDGSAYITGTSCTDTNPGAAGSTHRYIVKAVDCIQLWADNCTPDYNGTEAHKDVTLSAGPAPPPPALITATIVDGLPTLDWNSVPGASFYRIYRDGTSLGDRIDETLTGSTGYTDSHPGDTTRHTYYVTAVDSSFNESLPSPPVTSP